ncbi:TonB-dependent receptor [Flavobacterium supellecticarium]|uniref:TonB-dependent receptor n=1 Tax=Flavobacterium supellecticarium TaxID=2565924 RepID=A0A4S3ZZ91_9FLAO|nr:outer membrane beta-barrel protein [Flavobacterium supellecticarium]THF51275.1 TonB-dependent receptor [Flavobacterium supellecticarium]
MQKITLLFALLLISCLSFAQNNIVLKGKVIDKNSGLPAESVTVYLSVVKDSTLIDYTITNKAGNFEFSVKKSTQPVFLKISMIGYEDYKQELDGIAASRDFGTIAIVESSKVLDEVIVKTEAPPIRIKKDTLEFNAASFKVRPDSNVETLLKQLPGVEVDNGKVTVNGKEVNQILVNGKPFFDKDGKIALQSLPSEIINKIQVTDTKTKKEEFSGQKASSNNATINLTIDEDKNKGFFGRFTGGYGTDSRYESSALINYFKGNRKISFLGSSNNINSAGFSMNEIFDNMSGGRNTSVNIGGDGSFGVNGMNFGGGKGITQSNMAGLNYADQFFKGFDVSGNYFYTDATSKNDNKSRYQNFLPDRTIITESVGNTREDKYMHNGSLIIEYKIDSTTTVYVSPRFSKGNTKYKSQSEEATMNENNRVLNDSDSNLYNESDSQNFSNSISFNKQFGKKGRSLGVDLDNSNSKDIGSNLNQSKTRFYDDNGALLRTDNRDQIRYNRNFNDRVEIDLEYLEPVMDSVRLKLAVDYSRNKVLDTKTAYNFDTTTEDYTIQNDTLSNFLRSITTTISPKAGINIEKNKFFLSSYFGTNITRLDNESYYLYRNTKLIRDYILPSASLYMSYKLSKAKSFSMNYSYRVSFPSAVQMLPVDDPSNALVSYIGNPDLDPTKSHSAGVYLRNYNYATRSGYSFSVTGQYYDSQIIASTIYDESAKRYTTYQNISGGFSLTGGGNWSKSHVIDMHKLRIGVSPSLSLTKDKGYTNGELFDALNYRFRTRFNLNWDYGELLTVSPSYTYSYNVTNYTNYTVNSASNYTHLFNLQTTSYWPKGLVIGNDFGYTYNSAISDGFKKDFYLWNTSVGYNFFNERMLFKVKVYDLLNQNQSAIRTIGATSIRDEENTVLKRYAMFSLTYKIEKFAGKEKKSRGRRPGVF